MQKQERKLKYGIRLQKLYCVLLSLFKSRLSQLHVQAP